MCNCKQMRVCRIWCVGRLVASAAPTIHTNWTDRQASEKANGRTWGTAYAAGRQEWEEEEGVVIQLDIATHYTGPVVGVGVEWEEIICKYADS